jgi:hypothetical protein
LGIVRQEHLSEVYGEAIPPLHQVRREVIDELRGTVAKESVGPRRYVIQETGFEWVVLRVEAERAYRVAEFYDEDEARGFVKWRNEG